MDNNTNGNVVTNAFRQVMRLASGIWAVIMWDQYIVTNAFRQVMRLAFKLGRALLSSGIVGHKCLSAGDAFSIARKKREVKDVIRGG